MRWRNIAAETAGWKLDHFAETARRNVMLTDRRLRALACTALVLLLAGCGSKGLNSVQVTPATQSLAVGQTAQFTAVGTYGNASRPSTQNITSTVTWTSSIPAVATVNASGVATGCERRHNYDHSRSIGFNGPVSSSATLVVSGVRRRLRCGAVSFRSPLFPARFQSAICRVPGNSWRSERIRPPRPYEILQTHP